MLENQGTGGRFLAGARGFSLLRSFQAGPKDYLSYFTLATGEQQERDDVSLPSSGKLRTVELYLHSSISVLGA